MLRLRELHVSLSIYLCHRCGQTTTKHPSLCRSQLPPHFAAPLTKSNRRTTPAAPTSVGVQPKDFWRRGGGQRLDEGRVRLVGPLRGRIVKWRAAEPAGWAGRGNAGRCTSVSAVPTVQSLHHAPGLFRGSLSTGLYNHAHQMVWHHHDVVSMPSSPWFNETPSHLYPSSSASRQ
jgi:hypothetical protein